MIKRLIILLLLTVSVFATVTDTTTKHQYFEPNGSTTTFTFTMPCNSSDDIKVEKVLTSTGVPTLLVEDTDYTIAATRDDYLNGGVVTISPALAATYGLTITRDIIGTQETVSGAVNPVTIEAMVDKSTRQYQDNRNKINLKTIRIPDSDPSTAYAELGNWKDRAGKILGFDDPTGAPIAIEELPATSAAVSTFMKTVVDDIDADHATATLQTIKVFNVQNPAYGAVADSGTTDNTEEIQAAVDAAELVGGVVYFPPSTGYYGITDAITIDAPITLEGAGEASEIRQATSEKNAFVITASNVTVRGLKIYGPQYAALKFTEAGITTIGADSSNYITNVKIHDCIFENWGGAGIWANWIEDFDFNRNKIDNINYAGIVVFSVRRGEITWNKINNIVGSSLAYGIAVTRVTGNIVTYPRSSDILIENNIIRNIPTWEGIDVHAGHKITIRGNTIYNTNFGITGMTADNISCLDLMIVNNIIDSGATTGDVSQAGISLIGNTLESATGTISGNIIIDCGYDDLLSGAGIFLWFTDGVAITGNHIVRPSRCGIVFVAHNQGFNVTGNTIIDPWTDGGNGVTYAPAIYWHGDFNTGYSGGNTFLIESKSASAVLTYSYSVEDYSNQYIILGDDYSDATIARFYQNLEKQVHHSEAMLSLISDIVTFEGNVVTYEGNVVMYK